MFYLQSFESKTYACQAELSKTCSLVPAEHTFSYKRQDNAIDVFLHKDKKSGNL